MNYKYRQPYPNEIMHYGIRGQKWGVRRFQNEDGSLTAAGKERYDYAQEVASRTTKTMGNNGIRFSWGGGYDRPKWVSNKKAYTLIDRAEMWVTGNWHERALNTVINEGAYNQETTTYILNNVYGLSQEEIDALMEGELPDKYDHLSNDPYWLFRDRENYLLDQEAGRELATYHRNQDTINAIVEDYSKHTLPGLIDRVIENGKELLNKLYRLFG